MSNLLVIDFDYFFPEPELDPTFLYDWGHREAPLFIEFLWGSRATAFIANGLDLPTTTGEEATFWNRFQFKTDARLFVSESNSQAANEQITDFLTEDGPIDEVWLYDAHHDCGYSGPDMDWRSLAYKGEFSCEDWMLLYHTMGCDLHVRYPSWKPWALTGEPEPPIAVDRQVDTDEPEVEFDAVFLCRSGAWVPSWCDKQFFRFLGDAPFESYLDLLGDDYPLRERDFSIEQAEEEARMWEQLRKKDEERNARA